MREDDYNDDELNAREEEEENEEIANMLNEEYSNSEKYDKNETSNFFYTSIIINSAC